MLAAGGGAVRVSLSSPALPLKRTRACVSDAISRAKDCPLGSSEETAVLIPQKWPGGWRDRNSVYNPLPAWSLTRNPCCSDVGFLFALFFPHSCQSFSISPTWWENHKRPHGPCLVIWLPDFVCVCVHTRTCTRMVPAWEIYPAS